MILLIKYSPHREQAVDEAMVKYKGRTSLKQCMPMKPIKSGIKLRCRADSSNGYLCDFDVYTGKKARGLQHGLGCTVVANLCQHIKGKWPSVFFDIFFTLCKLIQDLYKDKIIFCGTVRQGRKEIPPALFDKDVIINLTRGHAMQRMKGPILHVLWMDKKAVWVLAQSHLLPQVIFLRFREGTGTEPWKQLPAHQ